MERIRQWIDWARRLYWLWGVLATSGLVGIATGLIARATSWLNAYGPIAWWLAGLLGFAVSSFGGGCIAWLRFQWIKGTATSKWKENVSTVNPLAKDFSHMRIRIADLVNPITNLIEDKSFTECELLGPANIVLLNSRFVGVGLSECDLVATRPSIPVQNVIFVRNIKMTNGKLLGCTIFAPVNAMSELMGIQGAYSVSITGNAEYDARRPPNALRGK